MKKTQKVYMLLAFGMLGLLNQISAQTDSSANRSMDNANHYQNSNTMTRDSNMIDQNSDAAIMQNRDDNSGNMQNEADGDRQRTNGTDLMNRNKVNMKDTTGTSDRHHSSMHDSMHAVKPVQPVKAATPVKTTQPVKPISPAKNADNKSNIKTTKNKTMYLVPDSTKRKDTLK
ncbi:MAG: hypothetical protein ABI855_13405 [Bacteroidota bacterium]